MRNKNKLLFLIFILISVFVSSIYLLLPNKFHSLDNRLRDFYFSIRGPIETSSNIVIIDIDEKSIKELGQWPWERDKISQILTNLSNNGAGIIGLDIMFSEADKTSPKQFAKKWGFNPTNMPDFDKILANTIHNTPTILGFLFYFDIKNQNIAPDIPTLLIEKKKKYGEFLPISKGVLTNIDTIQNAGYSSGFINSLPDDSGIIRSIPLLIKYDDSIYPALSLEMYRLAINANKIITTYSQAGISNISLSKHIVPTDRFGKLYINFKGPARSYKYISAIDIYNNTINKSMLENKFILIGTSASGLMDLRATPMDSVIAGVEIHANAIDNLLNNDMLVKPSWNELANLIIIIFIIFTVVIIFSRLALVPLLIIYTFFILGILYFTYYMLFTQLIILNIIFPLFAMVVSLIATLGIKYIFEFRQKEIIKKSFSRKVSKQVMDDLLIHSEDTDFTSKELEVTIYFSDIRNFTTISEELKHPKIVTNFLNFYMTTMVKYIENNKGTIDKFIGDAIMAYWNAPLSVENHADKAVKTALLQIQQRDIINKTIKQEFGFNVDYGIGINTGNVIVGEIGSHGRSDYTIIGDSVNLASRLEGLCKPYKVRLIISEFTKKQLVDKYVIQLLDIVIVKGKHEPIKIYEVLSSGEVDKEKKIELQKYNDAHQMYLAANFTDAITLFQELYKKYNKPLYSLYTQRCQTLEKKHIKDFDGVYTYTTK